LKAAPVSSARKVKLVSSTMGFWCCLGAIPTNLCCWAAKIGQIFPLIAPILAALMPWAPLIIVLSILALMVAVRLATTSPYPSIHVLPGEESFVAFDSQAKEKSVEWECNMFEEREGEDGERVDLSVVVPAYNETERLPAMLDQAVEFLQNSKVNTSGVDTWEVIVVDDGSKDKTTETALEYAVSLGTQKFRVLTLAKNLGKGGAVRRGVRVARGRTVIYADADGATTFSELNKVYAKLNQVAKTEGSKYFGMICGSRAHLEQESVAQRTLFRTILMYGFHACVRIFGCKGVQDTQCGFKAMTRDTARVLFSNMHIERWAFDVELIRIAEMTGMPVAEVAVEWTEIDGSKLDPMSASIQMLRDLVLLWARYLTGAWKLRAI